MDKTNTTKKLRHVVPLMAVTVMFLFLGLGCRNNQKQVASLPQITLQYWTVWDEPDAFAQTIQAYEALHPNVTINVKKVSFADYHDALVEAWARDAGPDIFSIPNTSVGRYSDFITPLPNTLTLPKLNVSGSGCSKNVKLVDETTPTLAPDHLDDTFIPAVASDVVRDNKIEGLPLASDTLALFYNKDLLNNSNIIAPPQTWTELINMVDASKNTLTKIGDKNTIIQSGIALGTSTTINRPTDILATLMMQSGAQMTDATGKTVTFQNASARDATYNPGTSALDFYTAFGNPSRVTYSWNDTLGDASEAFASGKVGFFIGYEYQMSILRTQNPQLHFGVAPLPQITTDGPQIDFANYWVETVAKRTQHADQAWDFLLFATSNPQVRSYLNTTKKLTALKSILQEQQTDLDLGVFAKQLLIAKNWYHGYDDSVMEQSLKQMIDDVLAGKTAEEVIGLGAQKVQQTYRKQ